MNARHWFVCLVFVAAAVAAPSADTAELAPAQRDKLVWIDQQLQKVVSLYRDRKTDDIQKLLIEIKDAIAEVQTAADGDATIEPVLNPFRARLAAAEKLASYVPPAVAAAAARPMPVKPTPGAVPAGGVSFTKEIAPILVGKCNGCHVRGNSGGFNMATYQALMNRPNGAFPAVLAGKGDQSMIVERVASNEMPPNGNKLTDAEIALLVKWINEGAKYDGADPAEPLGTGTPGAPAQPQPTQVVRATGNEKISFMKHVAPILLDNCMGCHGAANNPPSGYGMRTFQGLLNDGDSRQPPIKPGDAEGSFIVKMLRGTGKGLDGTTTLRRMPNRSGPLDDADMQTIITWINEGAKFDGDSPTELIQYLWDVEQAKKATHEELTASRKGRVETFWKRANPDSPYEILETVDFTILGNLGPVRMQEFAKAAEDEKNKLVASLKLPTTGPLVKGKIAILVFDKKFEYSEFGRVAEGRELHPAINAHWKFNYIDCYAGIAAQSTTEDTAPLISEVVSGAYLDSLGSMSPRWFAVGTARNLAAKIHAKSPTVKAWEDALGPAMASGMTSDSVTSTSNLDNNSAALAQGFVKELMKTPAWSVLIGGVIKGSRFDGSFQQAFKSAPAPLMKKWLGR